MGQMEICGHKVLVKPDPIEKTHDLGNGKQLVLAGQDEKMQRALQQWGTIVGVGPDAWLAFRKIDDNGIERNGKPWAKVGDKVFYSRNAGRFVNHPETDELFTLMNDNDVSIVYRKDEVNS